MKNKREKKRKKEYIKNKLKFLKNSIDRGVDL